jgi:hypothetical protein
MPLPDGSIECVPEEGATPEELEIIQQIKADMLNRPIVPPEEPSKIPTLQEQVDAICSVVDMILMGELPII